MAVLWIVNLFNGTGLDNVYHVTQFAKYISIALMILTLIYKNRGVSGLEFKKTSFYAFFLMLVVFISSSIFQNYGILALDYLWVFCLVYLIAQFPVDEYTVRFTGYIYGVAGLVVLYIFDYGTFFSGWNENSIAMLGMHSFLVFIVPFFKESKISNKIVLIIGTVVFSVLIIPTESRSGILFAIIGSLFAIGVIPRQWILKKNVRILIILLIPLIIALIVIIVANSSIFFKLNEWSYESFKKPIFNGRDELWNSGLKVWLANFLIGTGNINHYPYHNSAVICLVSYGIAGYYFWIKSFYRIVEMAKKYIGDYIVKGYLIVFFVLYIQQSVEMGFISSTPSIIAYVMLGLMLGRINYIRRWDAYEKS